MVSEKPVYEETPEEIGEYFSSGDFGRAGGNLMSLTFYLWAIFYLLKMDWFKELVRWSVASKSEEGYIKSINIRQPIIHDYGCANGDGTALLQIMMPGAKIKGFDVSQVVVEQASGRWPTMKFEVGDVRSPQQEADIIYTSHTIEHLQYPLETINKLKSLCQVLVVIVPVISSDNDGGHTDAVPTDEWINQLDNFSQTRYTTVRMDPKNNIPICEGNILMAIRGDKYSSEEL